MSVSSSLVAERLRWLGQRTRVSQTGETWNKRRDITGGGNGGEEVESSISMRKHTLREHYRLGRPSVTVCLVL